MNSSRAAVRPHRRPVPASASGRRAGWPWGPLAALARSRRTAYALLASVFLYPDAARLARIGASASHLRRERRIFAGLAIFPEWLSLLRRLQRMTGPDAEGMQAEYAGLFGLAGAGACPPYESHYLAPDPRRAPEAAAALEREYAAEGVSLNPSAGEAPDHIAVELEFMAFLCDREAGAWEWGVPEDGARALARQHLFLRQHLGRWAAHFSRTLGRAAPAGFYAAVGEAAAVFVHHDADVVALLVQGRLPATAAESSG